MSDQLDPDEHDDFRHADAEVPTPDASMCAPPKPFPVNWF